MQLRVRVKQIDHDGFNGRDHPPDIHCLGKYGWITNIQLVPDEDIAGHKDDFRGPTPVPPPLAVGYQVFYVVLDDNVGSYELMGHEIELVSAVHDGDL